MKRSSGRPAADGVRRGRVRRDRPLRAAAVALSALGVGIAAYLTYVHYADASPICVAGSAACERVQQSEYAELAGVPVALLGLLCYAAILAATLSGRELGRILAATLALAGVAFSAYLTVVELFVIEAICQWCVASALTMAALAAVATLRVVEGAPD